MSTLSTVVRLSGNPTPHGLPPGPLGPCRRSMPRAFQSQWQDCSELLGELGSQACPVWVGPCHLKSKLADHVEGHGSLSVASNHVHFPTPRLGGPEVSSPLVARPVPLGAHVTLEPWRHDLQTVGSVRVEVKGTGPGDSEYELVARRLHRKRGQRPELGTRWRSASLDLLPPALGSARGDWVTARRPPGWGPEDSEVGWARPRHYRRTRLACHKEQRKRGNSDHFLLSTPVAGFGFPSADGATCPPALLLADRPMGTRRVLGPGSPRRIHKSTTCSTPPPGPHPVLTAAGFHRILLDHTMRSIAVAERLRSALVPFQPLDDKRMSRREEFGQHLDELQALLVKHRVHVVRSSDGRLRPGALAPWRETEQARGISESVRKAKVASYASTPTSRTRCGSCPPSTPSRSRAFPTVNGRPSW